MASADVRGRRRDGRSRRRGPRERGRGRAPLAAQGRAVPRPARRSRRDLAAAAADIDTAGRGHPARRRHHRHRRRPGARRTASRPSRCSTSATAGSTASRATSWCQVTADHSVVQELVDAGALAARGRRAPSRTATSSPGRSDSATIPRPDFVMVPARAGPAAADLLRRPHRRSSATTRIRLHLAAGMPARRDRERPRGCGARRRRTRQRHGRDRRRGRRLRPVVAPPDLGAP